MSVSTNKGSFVVVSDFHSHEWPLAKIIDYYLNEHDCIYILGDATDRGKSNTGARGINLLIKIMELTKKYPGRIHYVPGNHDQFLYGYASGTEAYVSEQTLLRNGGKHTIRDIKMLKFLNPSKFRELIDWLGSLHLQTKHEYDGKTYVMAHALFNQSLYEYNPNYSLKDYFCETNQKIKRQAFYTLWFRKEQDVYLSNELPDYKCIMVIGHTPQRSRENINLNLVNKSGLEIPVICVDGGITYNDNMQKYVGGRSNAEITYRGTHNPSNTLDNPSNSPNVTNLESDLENYQILDNYIVKLALYYIENHANDKSPEDIKRTIKEFILAYGVAAINQSNRSNLSFGEQLLTPEQCQELMFYKMDSLQVANINDLVSGYIDIILSNYIIASQLSRYDLKDTSYSICGYIFGGAVDGKQYKAGNLAAITNNNSARKIATLINPEDLKKVLKMFGYLSYGYASIESYIKTYLSDSLGDSNSHKPSL